MRHAIGLAASLVAFVLLLLMMPPIKPALTTPSCTSEQSNTGNTVITINAPSGQVPGSLLIAAISSIGTGGDSGWTPPAVFSTTLQSVGGFSVYSGTAASDTSYSWTGLDGGPNHSGMVVACNGVYGIDQSNLNNSVGTPATANSLTPTYADELSYLFYGSGNGLGTPSGYTLDQAASRGGGNTFSSDFFKQLTGSAATGDQVAASSGGFKGSQVLIIVSTPSGPTATPTSTPTLTPTPTLTTTPTATPTPVQPIQCISSAVSTPSVTGSPSTWTTTLPSGYNCATCITFIFAACNNGDVPGEASGWSRIFQGPGFDLSYRVYQTSDPSSVTQSMLAGTCGPGVATLTCSGVNPSAPFSYSNTTAIAGDYNQDPANIVRAPSVIPLVTKGMDLNFYGAWGAAPALTLDGSLTSIINASAGSDRLGIAYKYLNTTATRTGDTTATLGSFQPNVGAQVLLEPNSGGSSIGSPDVNGVTFAGVFYERQQNDDSGQVFINPGMVGARAGDYVSIPIVTAGIPGNLIPNGDHFDTGADSGSSATTLGFNDVLDGTADTCPAEPVYGPCYINHLIGGLWSGTGNIELQFNGSEVSTYGAMYYRSIDGTTVIDQAGKASLLSTTSETAPSLTPSFAPEILQTAFIGFQNAGGLTPATPQTGMDELEVNKDSSGEWVNMEGWKQLTSTSATGTYSASVNANADFAAFGITLADTVSGAPTPTPVPSFAHDINIFGAARPRSTPAIMGYR